jgi:hypothetical protein
LLIFVNSNAENLVDNPEPPDQAVSRQLSLVDEVRENLRQLRQTRLWTEASRSYPYGQPAPAPDETGLPPT